MREALETKLKELVGLVIEMAGRSQQMLDEAIRYLENADDALAESVRTCEERVNQLQNRVDDLAVRIAAEQQPVARDLRLVFVAARASTDLERIADEAVNILTNARYARSMPPLELAPEFVRINSLVRRQVADAVKALGTHDVAHAESIIELEEEVDDLRNTLFRMLLKQLITDPIAAQKYMSLILISRNLERAGDHATNIAEEVIYLVKGKDVRHQYDRSGRPRNRLLHLK